MLIDWSTIKAVKINGNICPRITFNGTTVWETPTTETFYLISEDNSLLITESD